MYFFKLLPFASLSILAMLFGGCSAAIDNVVDNEIQKMVEQENKKLPSDVGQGVRLMRLEYDEENNVLNMNYSVPDAQQFNANFARIKKETRDKVSDNASLQRALDNKIKIMHNYYDGSYDPKKKPFRNFETR